MRKKQAVSTNNPVTHFKAFTLLFLAGILLLGLGAIVGGGAWWVVGNSAPSQALTGATSFPDASYPDASMPTCRDHPASDCLLSVNPFYTKLKVNNGQSLAQKQTLANITLRLDWVYADNNYILVAYSLFRPEGYRLYTGPGASTLAFENQPLQNSLGPSTAGGNDNALAIIETFDTSTLPLTAGGLKLRFTLPGVTLEKIPPTPLPSQVTPQPTPPGELVAPVPTSTPGPADTLTAQTVTAEKAGQTITGPFSLEFTAKLAPVRILEPKQTVKASGGTATLEKIVITPMTERLFISGFNHEPDLRLQLVAGDAVYNPGALPENQTSCGKEPNGWVSCNLEPGTLEKQADWQIVLRRGADIPFPTPQPCPECAPPATLPTPEFSPTPLGPGGPWIFRIKL
ncbi:MAG: hypothetical protein J0I20_13435 [Chloroflexi bacterium]|nr:hypothetical protein [Chloroflexota bacterium]OJV92851.1 MAG: hypothetical protein BGO39_30315 [Chloroflexi bacterium 54-19]